MDHAQRPQDHDLSRRDRAEVQNHSVNIGKGEQFERKFLDVSPNNRIPAIVDHDPPGGGAPIAVFESGAMLLYLAEKTGKFLARDLRARTEEIQWLFWQMGGLGPMSGQNNHFSNYAVDKIPYAMDRYRNEVNRLYGVMDRRLADRPYLGGEYSVADMASYPWIVPYERQGQKIEDFPNLKRWFEAIRARPGGRARLCPGQGGQPEPGRHSHRRGARDPVRPDRGLGAGGGALSAASFRSRQRPDCAPPSSNLSVTDRASGEVACSGFIVLQSLPKFHAKMNVLKHFAALSTPVVFDSRDRRASRIGGDAMAANTGSDATTQAAFALHRFGLGPRAGSLAAIAARSPRRADRRSREAAAPRA